MQMALTLSIAANALLAAGFMWLWATLRERDRTSYALLGLLLGPFALLLLLTDSKPASRGA